MINIQKVTFNQCRRISKYLDRDKTAKNIRQCFLDYFVKENNHNFVRSSPVVPYCDPTVAFVNAGMNQFKGIFLGTQTPRFARVTNSQKCVRVGGKHNDLDIVGTDGYHHTFFEMLGNWSFGDYFKAEACAMAWKLLIDVYKLNKSNLYVTYFAGDEKLGLEADLECRDIWRVIGVPEKQILPFGLKENFWEMGPVGPCGPCSEIHYDHLGASNRAHFVNKNLPDLTELWNIVFIQYNRRIILHLSLPEVKFSPKLKTFLGWVTLPRFPDGSLEALPKKHIDTGMGLERLVAIVQGSKSTYDTDIFAYLFSAIHKICPYLPKYNGLYGEKDWNSMDTSYRILADHSRMITACLADGMIPEENQKLRRVMRKAFLLSETSFKTDKGLLKELTNYVVENLGAVYPEMETNIKQVQQIIDYEEEVYKSIRRSASDDWQKLTSEVPALVSLDIIEMPGLISAIKDIRNSNISAISSTFAFKLYDTYGLDVEVIKQLAQCLHLSFSEADFEVEMENHRKCGRQLFSASFNTLFKSLKTHAKETNDSYKYDYEKQNQHYIFKEVSVKVLKIFYENCLLKEIPPNVECSLVFDQTNCYSESGGQSSDVGLAKFDNCIFEIFDVQKLHGYVLHKGVLISSNNCDRLKTDDQGILQINEEIRLDNMRNHTAVHLLNATLKKIKGITCQKSSKVTKDYLNLDVSMFGSKLSIEDIKEIEKCVCEIIKAGLNVDTKVINSQQLLSLDNITLIPGEIYPDNEIRIIEITNENFISREPCCGTHVLNTSDLEDFCIISLRSLGRSTASICAVTGSRAELARQNGDDILQDIRRFQINIRENIDKPEMLDIAISMLKQRLFYDNHDSNILPLTIKHQCLEELDKLSKIVKESSRSNLKELIEIEMQNVIQTNIMKTKTNKEYLVHYLRSSMIFDSVPLQKATKLCPDIPVLVISFTDNMVKARCVVPNNYKTENFTAQKWMNELTKIFNTTASAPRGQDPQLVCNLKAKKVNIQDWKNLLTEGLEAAQNYADKHIL